MERGLFYDPSVHSNALKKKKKTEFAAVLRSIRGFIPSNDSGTCRGEKRVVRYDRERCLVNVSQNVSFIVCGIVFQSKETADSSFFFLPYFFSPEFDSRKKYSNPFRVPKKSMFRGKREKKEKQIEGKRFHRRIGRVRNVFVQYKPAESGLLFTLHGIHSSPAKRVKTQKSESLFVTSFDVPINSFEITAALSKIQISGKLLPLLQKSI